VPEDETEQQGRDCCPCQFRFQAELPAAGGRRSPATPANSKPL
jgi:hypothetical protein